MLARKYDNYAWQEQPAEQYEVQQPARRKVHRPDPRRVLRNRILKAFLFIMAAYFIVVLRSNAMVQYGNELVSLQQQEAQLITKNNELKIEVEQLKGPERIIGLAEQYLGMSVARSNIYVKAGGSSNSLAVHNK